MRLAIIDQMVKVFFKTVDSQMTIEDWEVLKLCEIKDGVLKVRRDDRQWTIPQWVKKNLKSTLTQTSNSESNVQNAENQQN